MRTVAGRSRRRVMNLMMGRRRMRRILGMRGRGKRKNGPSSGSLLCDRYALWVDGRFGKRIDRGVGSELMYVWEPMDG